jgi:hypothetical protein
MNTGGSEKLAASIFRAQELLDFLNPQEGGRKIRNVGNR